MLPSCHPVIAPLGLIFAVSCGPLETQISLWLRAALFQRLQEI
jgi:hypothetical protein